MFVDYTGGRTLAHRLDPRTKLAVFGAAVVASFLFPHPAPNALLALAAVALLVWLRVPWSSLRPLVGPLVPVLFLIVLFSASGYGPDAFDAPAYRRVVAHLWFGDRLPLTVGGLALGVTLALRIVTMVSLSSALTASTPIEEFVAVLQRARLPFPLVFIVVTALRFVPTMQRRAQQVLDAQRARGARIDAGGPIGRIRAHIPVMVPLIAGGIRMSEDLAAAMMNRGYGATRHPTVLVVLRPRPVDALVVAGAVAFLAAAVAARASGWWQL